MDLGQAMWLKSVHSSANGCVEVAFIDNHVALRDSKHKEGPVLIFTPVEWEAFIGTVSDGQFMLAARREMLESMS